MTGTARKRLTRAESQQQTRERLLAAAAQVFSQRGFHAASVEDVAETAGFSKGAVYSNFASKEELFLALLDQHLESELHAMEGAVEGCDGSGPKGEARRPRFAQHLEQGQMWNMLAMEFWLHAMRDEHTRALLAERYQAARTVLAARLRERYDVAGNSPPVPVEYLAWTLLALGTGLAVQTYLEPGALPVDLYQSVTDLLLGQPSDLST